MYLLFTNPHWPVLRLVTVPEHSVNNTKYEDRGFCFFESSIAVAGAMYVKSLPESTMLPTPVPMIPSHFEAELDKKIFTAVNVGSPAAIMKMVKDMYQQIWLTVEEKTKQLIFFNWEDSQCEEFVKIIDRFSALTTIRLVDFRASDEVIHRLKSICRSRCVQFEHTGVPQSSSSQTR